jgi:hypothetical protein
MKSNQRASQPVTHIIHLLVIQPVLQLDREPIRLPLKVSANSINADASDRFQGGYDHLEQKESDDGGWMSCYFLGKVE